jgi:thiamine-monophosphate kinase
MSEPFTAVSEIGEFGLIDRLSETLGTARVDGLVTGIGDDAAVYRIGGGRVHVLTTDILVEGVHFDRTFAPLGLLGYKALAVNVSDVVAMNARPRFATVTVGLPNNVSVEQAETLYQGIARAADRFGVAVVGGDTTAAERLLVSVALVGEAAEDEIVHRSGAEPGDLLCVTGSLGAAAAGLKILLSEKEAFLADRQPDLSSWTYVVERHLAPQPRLDRLETWRAAAFRPKALIDISDGLASETHHICRASAVGGIVDLALLPIHVDTFRAAERFEERPEAYALYGGEDYELLFAAAPNDLARLAEDTYAVVGEVTEAIDGIVLRLPDGELAPLDARGFQHF